MFDLDRLESACAAHIARFAAEHPDEVVYGFSIDADLLCLGSQAEYEAGVAYLARRPGRPPTPDELDELRTNTGDWRYQGFAQMTEADGFDRAAYRAHYDLDAAEQRVSDYARAMDALIERLVRRGAFDPLRRTADFFANRVEHGY